jgi:hypothetical protein
MSLLSFKVCQQLKVCDIQGVLSPISEWSWLSGCVRQINCLLFTSDIVCLKAVRLRFGSCKRRMGRARKCGPGPTWGSSGRISLCYRRQSGGTGAFGT